ncbi:MAG: tetratricopeptide repeat protein [Thermodesulfobacteriota bacterium]
MHASIDPLAPGKERWRIPVVFMALGLLCLAVYGNTLRAPFVFDDNLNIPKNPHIRVRDLSPSSLADIIRSRSITRPIPVLSFALNYYFHGYQVAGYHAVNWLIHVINGLLVYLLTRQTLALLKKEIPAAPFLTAALWLVNPVHTQSVTYIVQRMTSLSALFYLAALAMYIRARTVPPEAGRRRTAAAPWLIGSGLSGICALASKESAITLPLMIFLYEWFFIRDLETGFIRRQATTLFAMAAILTVLVFIYLKGDPVTAILATYEKKPFTMGERLLTQPRVIIHYISLLLLPLPERLTVDHWVTVSTSLTRPATTLPALALLLLTVITAVRKARRSRLFSFAILWFLGALAVESSIIGLAMLVEHRTYLPSVFPFMAMACVLLQRIAPRRLAMTTIVLLIAVCGFWTRQRNGIWADEVRLWQDAIQKSPASFIAYNNLGMALGKQRRNEEGIAACRQSIALSPPKVNTADAYNNISRMYDDLGDTEKAIDFGQRAVQINPNLAEAHMNLGRALLTANRLDEAVTHLETSVRLSPWLTPAYPLLARAGYQKDGDIGRAMEICSRALAVDPDNADAEVMLGALLQHGGDPHQGLFHLKRVLDRFPFHPQANLNAGIALNTLNRPEEAVAFLTRAAEATPKLARARAELGSALLAANRLDEARTELTRALDLSPDDPAVLAKLALISEKKRQWNEAAYYYRRALSVAPEAPDLLNQLAVVLAGSQAYGEAAGVLEKLEKLLPGSATVSFNLACLYARQNQTDNALGQLEKAMEKGYHDIEALRTDPDLESIRDTPRFQQMMNHLKDTP